MRGVFGVRALQYGHKCDLFGVFGFIVCPTYRMIVVQTFQHIPFRTHQLYRDRDNEPRCSRGRVRGRVRTNELFRGHRVCGYDNRWCVCV